MYRHHDGHGKEGRIESLKAAVKRGRACMRPPQMDGALPCVAFGNKARPLQGEAQRAPCSFLAHTRTHARARITHTHAAHATKINTNTNKGINEGILSLDEQPGERSAAPSSSAAGTYIARPRANIEEIK